MRPRADPHGGHGAHGDAHGAQGAHGEHGHGSHRYGEEPTGYLFNIRVRPRPLLPFFILI